MALPRCVGLCISRLGRLGSATSETFAFTHCHSQLESDWSLFGIVREDVADILRLLSLWYTTITEPPARVFNRVSFFIQDHYIGILAWSLFALAIHRAFMSGPDGIDGTYRPDPDVDMPSSVTTTQKGWKSGTSRGQVASARVPVPTLLTFWFEA